MNKSNQISDDFKVLLYIYEQTEINNKNVYFKKIIEETGIQQSVVNKSIDKLYDNTMIDAKWAKREDGCYAYCYNVSDDFLGFTKGLYNATHKSQAKNNSNKAAKVQQKKPANEKDDSALKR